ncbi:hypothetical protein BMETH_441_1 [methanotrophic bacterial endosymbiont of Bathymodiolus sp.]|nr:hypothetical protein BMETH_441_1 [methanotrophic bacterial endosymbiont of Bathymodiolus sp.]
MLFKLLSSVFYFHESFSRLFPPNMRHVERRFSPPLSAISAG